ncbi:MAG: GNAT family N-acetyltransferase [Cyclobacteriaceae bacterium]
MNVEKLEWDSNFFGFLVYKINISSPLELNSNLICNLFKNNVRLIYVFLEKGVISSDILAKVNGKLVDTKVIYSKKLEHIFLQKKSYITEFEGPYLDEKLFELVFQSGEESRFKKDKLLPEGSFERLYTIWIEKSLKNSNTHKFFIYQLDNEIVGFISVEIKDKFGQIGLIAVDYSHRGKGIGKELLMKAESFLFSKNIYELRIPTQKTNNRACKFYEGCDYKVLNQTNIYHLHNID